MTNDIAASRRLLSEVRRRTRRTRSVRGLAWTAAALAALVVVSFALDWSLDLPRAVRAVHLAVTVVLLLVAARWAFAPLRRREEDGDVAAAIERDVPEFEDRLVSALDFERRLADPDEPESREMMAAAVREASAIAGRLDAGLLVDARPARRALTAAVAGAAVVLAVQSVLPDAFALWLRRGLLLEDVSWPKRTTIRILGVPESGTIVVTRGEDLRIVAEADGHRPEDLDLHVEEYADAPDGTDADAAPREVAWRDVRKMLPVPEQPGRYAFDIRSVAASFRFWVTGGDDLDEHPSVEVRARIPPRVASFTARVTYPEYSNVPPATIRERAFDVLAGSTVELSFKSNMPLVSAQLLPSKNPAEDLALAADGLSFSKTYTARETLEFQLTLVAAAGHRNRPDDDLYRIDVVSDRVPAIRVLYPHERLMRTPDGIVPVKVLAEDDFGLGEIRLEVKEGSNAAATSVLWSAPPRTDGSAPDKRVHVYRPLDLRAFAGDGGVQPKQGDILTIGVSGSDTAGGVSEPRQVTVEVVAIGELETKLQGQMTRLREDLSTMRRAQRRTVTAIRELRGAVAGAAADTGALRRTRDLQVDQGRVGSDVARFLAGIERVFDSWVLNRAGSIPTIDRLLPLYHEALQAPPDDTGEVFPASLYAKILAEKRANRLYDPEVLGTLLDVLDMGDDVMRQRVPVADDALERFAAEAGAGAPALEEAERAAAEVLAALDRIDERMQRFEDLSELVRMAREIHEAEAGIAEDPTKKSSPQEK